MVLALGFTTRPIVGRVRWGALVWGKVREVLSPSLLGLPRVGVRVRKAMFLLCFFGGVFLGLGLGWCPGWVVRGHGERGVLRLGLGMLVLTHQAGFYSRDPSVGPNVPQLGGCFYRVGPIVVGVGTGMNGPGRGKLPILVVSPGGVGVRVWY